MLMTALQTKAKKLPEKPAVEQKGFKAFLKKNKIGRASCRERVCQYV